MQLEKIKVQAQEKNCCDTDKSPVDQQAVNLEHSDDDGHDHGSLETAFWLNHWPLWLCWRYSMLSEYSGLNLKIGWFTLTSFTIPVLLDDMNLVKQI